MQLGESHRYEEGDWGRPLDGVTVLAIEQMQVLPFATQMLARLGADVIKVEPPGRGDSGRQSLPAITRANGESLGATFLRNNLCKRSIAVDVTTERGRDLVLELAGKVDVVAENMGPGRADRLGLGWKDMAQRHPRLVYVSISGFGTLDPSPYEKWPAYAVVAEAMSGMYEYARQPHQPPIVNPLGGIGDSGTGLYALVGVLAALRHRDRTGQGQLVDIAMYDAMVNLLDLAFNYWSLGLRRDPDEPRRLPLILDSFKARDGWVVLQVARPHQFARLAALLGRDEWTTDERFAGTGWFEQWEAAVRPALEAWAADKSTLDTAKTLAEAGLAAAPCYSGAQVGTDEHVVAHRMVVEIPRADGVEQPVWVAGNPIKMSKVPDGPDRDYPALGEHTDEVLADLLGMDEGTLAELRSQGVVGERPADA
jgi:crotonobetainyl-CoA:carnitine CoA-transferase CaiB-like acyl-CoA transferase